MCENDEAVNTWFRSLDDWAIVKAADEQPQIVHAAKEYRLCNGHMRGVIRELAATVPGVREWLIANPPGGK